jgi:ParB family transcriptional regulator, chromosome partitioning protein
MGKKRGLGKGLESLGLNELLTGTKTADTSDLGVLKNIALSECHPSRFQPRKHMDPAQIKELADSIKSQGVLQPILLRPAKEGTGYEIIAGERRWRAACQAEIGTIPALVRDLTAEQCMAQALIENIQRQDLNPIEEANAYHKLVTEFSLSHDEVAESVGKSRSSITNLMRLLKLSPAVSEFLVQSKIEMGHARALLTLPEDQQEEVATAIISKQLSVRETEAIIRNSKKPSGNVALKKPLNSDLMLIKDKLSSLLEAKIQLQQQRSGKGKIIIHFKNEDEFAELVEKIGS